MFAYPPAPPAINSFGGEVNDVEEVRRARVDLVALSHFLHF